MTLAWIAVRVMGRDRFVETGITRIMQAPVAGTGSPA